MNAHVQTACAAAALAAVVATATADELRNIKPGQAIPEFSLPALDGGRLGSAELAGKALILVFLSAEQKSSEAAASAAGDVWRKLRRQDLALVYATADTGAAPYFRRLADSWGLHQPLLLDVDRELYGKLGLIVLPTTIVVDRQGRLAHVLSSYRGDYEQVLEAYTEHALGDLDDQGLEKRLQAPTFERGRPADRIERHRAAARILRESGLLPDAEKELRAAIAIDPAYPDVLLDLASLLIAAGRIEEAALIVDEVLARQPDHRRGRLLRGVVLYREGDLDQAAPLLEEALLLNPDPVQTHYYLGLICEQKGETSKALEHYRASLSRLLADRPL